MSAISSWIWKWPPPTSTFLPYVGKLQAQLRHFVTLSKNERFVRFYCIWHDEMKVLLHYEMIAVKTSRLVPSHMWNRMSSVVWLIVWILAPTVARAATCIRTTKLVIHTCARSRWTFQSTFLAFTDFNVELTFFNWLLGQKKWLSGVFNFIPPTR